VFDTSGKLASIKGAALSMRSINAAASSEGPVNIAQENEELKVFELRDEPLGRRGGRQVWAILPLHKYFFCDP